MGRWQREILWASSTTPHPPPNLAHAMSTASYPRDVCLVSQARRRKILHGDRSLTLLRSPPTEGQRFQKKTCMTTAWRTDKRPTNQTPHTTTNRRGEIYSQSRQTYQRKGKRQTETRARFVRETTGVGGFTHTRRGAASGENNKKARATDARKRPRLRAQADGSHHPLLPAGVRKNNNIFSNSLRGPNLT